MKKKVLVGLSGGVDSAVTASILIKQGYDVIAGFMKNYADESNPTCHTREDRNSALQVAKHLGIKVFTIFDFREEYNQTIINYIVQGYHKGRTPNPDVLCNTKIKFDLFLKYGRDLGCDFVATGHYARITEDKGVYSLLKGTDSNKDQSYFLSGLNQYQLQHSLYPLGDMTKTEVREYAKEIHLPNANRPDSQGLCFIGKVPMKEFLREHLPIQKGSLVDTEGNILGEHDGIRFYTVGQRQGLGLGGGPWFVTKRDKDTNTLTVQSGEAPSLYHSSLTATDLHRTSTAPEEGATLHAKIRYRQADQACTIHYIDKEKLLVNFSTHQRAIASGQIIVFYEGDTVVGNATILQAVS